MLGLTYRNRSTGEIVCRLAVAIDQSAGLNHRTVIVFCPQDHENTVFVRKQSEFNTIFELMEEPTP